MRVLLSLCFNGGTEITMVPIGAKAPVGIIVYFSHCATVAGVVLFQQWWMQQAW